MEQRITFQGRAIMAIGGAMDYRRSISSLQEQVNSFRATLVTDHTLLRADLRGLITNVEQQICKAKSKATARRTSPALSGAPLSPPHPPLPPPPTRAALPAPPVQSPDLNLEGAELPAHDQNLPARSSLGLINGPLFPPLP